MFWDKGERTTRQCGTGAGCFLFAGPALGPVPGWERGETEWFAPLFFVVTDLRRKDRIPLKNKISRKDKFSGLIFFMPPFIMFVVSDLEINGYILRLCIEGVAVFLGIILVNRVRTLEWFFIVLGVVWDYVVLIYEIFRKTGFFEADFFKFVDIGAGVLPSVFFALGILCFLVKLRR